MSPHEISFTCSIQKLRHLRPTQKKIKQKNFFGFSEISELRDKILLGTSGFPDEESGISCILRNLLIFGKSKNIFLLNQSLQFRIYFEAMDLIR